MAEPQPSKLAMRVRFPSPAPCRCCPGSSHESVLLSPVNLLAVLVRKSKRGIMDDDFDPLSLPVDAFDRQVIILTWNRDIHIDGELERQHTAEIAAINAGQQVTGAWNVGNHVNIKVGSWCFLLTQGKRHPREIVALGIVTRSPYADEHYADPNKDTNYVDFDWIDMRPLGDGIPIEVAERVAPDVRWRKGWQQSGATLRNPAGGELVRLWTGAIPEPRPKPRGSVPRREGAVKWIESIRYERDPRARADALKYHGRSCSVCDFDPVEFYGREIGERLIHVHHIVPISKIGEEYEVDPKTDLAPLCPNCHNAIHKTDPVMTPKQLRKYVLGK